MEIEAASCFAVGALLSISLSPGAPAANARQETGPPLILSHFLLAAWGIVLWIIYLAADEDGLVCVAVVALAGVAVLGFTMFAIWLADDGAAPPPETPSRRTPAVNNLPVSLSGCTASSQLQRSSSCCSPRLAFAGVNDETPELNPVTAIDQRER